MKKSISLGEVRSRQGLSSISEKKLSSTIKPPTNMIRNSWENILNNHLNYDYSYAFNTEQVDAC